MKLTINEGIDVLKQGWLQVWMDEGVHRSELMYGRKLHTNTQEKTITMMSF